MYLFYALPLFLVYFSVEILMIIPLYGKGFVIFNYHTNVNENKS
jgi:hypothetical protein